MRARVYVCDQTLRASVSREPKITHFFSHSYARSSSKFYEQKQTAIIVNAFYIPFVLATNFRKNIMGFSFFSPLVLFFLVPTKQICICLFTER